MQYTTSVGDKWVVEDRWSGFTPLLDSLLENPDIGLAGACVFGAILRFCMMRRGICDATQVNIALKSGVDERTVRNQIPKLIKLGYVEDLTPNVRNKPHIYRSTGKAGIRTTTEAYDFGRKEIPTTMTQIPAGRKEIPAQPERDSVEETRIQVNKQDSLNSDFSNPQGQEVGDALIEVEDFPEDYPDLTCWRQPSIENFSPPDPPHPLEPSSPGEIYLFDKLRANARLNKWRCPKKFPTIEAKQKFDAAEVRLGNTISEAVDQALCMGIKDVPRICAYVSKYDNAKYQPPPIQIIDPRSLASEVH